MNRLVILLVGLVGASVGQANVRLDWTMDAVSVQAQLLDALVLYKEKIQPGSAQGPVTYTNGEAKVADARSTVSCQSRQLGDAAVQSYTCTLPTDTHWSPNRKSVSAVLYQSIQKLLAEDHANPEVTGEGNNLNRKVKLEDAKARLSCEEKSRVLGLARNLYRCQLQLKNP